MTQSRRQQSPLSLMLAKAMDKKAFPEVSRAGRALEEPEEAWECSQSPLPHWAHLKQQLQQRGGVEIRAKMNAKNPVQRQSLPPRPSSLLEKQFWSGVLGAVGNVQGV